MSPIVVTERIAAPPDRVFALLADFAGAPQRIPGIKRVEMLTPGSVGVGTRFRETRVMYGREATEEMAVTEFDPPRGYAVGCDSHGVRFRSAFRVMAEGQGTAVEMSVSAEPLTFLARVMSVLARPMLKSVATVCATDLAAIKSAAETRG